MTQDRTDSASQREPAATEDALLARLEETDLAALGALLAGEPSLRDARVVERLEDEVARLVHVDLDRADHMALLAETLAKIVGDHPARARGRRARAHVLYVGGEHEAAVERYREALRLFEERSEEWEIARTLSSSLPPLAHLGRYAEAQAAADRAREIFRLTGDTLHLARLESNRANLHYRLDEFQQAMDLYRSALEQLRAYGEPHDVAVALRNIAACHVSLNRFPDATAAYEEARAHADEHGLSRLVVESEYNIAYLHNRRGESTRAIELYQAARERADRLGDRYHSALCDLDQAELCLEMDLVGEAARLASRGYESFSALDMRGQAARAQELLGRARAMFEAEGNRVGTAARGVESPTRSQTRRTSPPVQRPGGRSQSGARSPASRPRTRDTRSPRR